MWNLDKSLKLIRALQETSKTFGFHIALGGGVLNKGESMKDLDLYFHPFANPDVPESYEKLISWLTTIWGEPSKLGDYDEPAEEGQMLDQPEPAGVFARAPVMEWRENPDRPPAPPPRYRPVPINPGQWFDQNFNPLDPPQWQVERIVYNDPAIGPMVMGEPPVVETRKRKDVRKVYKHKLKFVRAGNERIDVFIL